MTGRDRREERREKKKKTDGNIMCEVMDFIQEHRQTPEQKWDSCIMFKIADQIISV